MKNQFLIYTLLLFPIYMLAQEKGVKRIFYNDSILAIERWFGEDKKIDSLKSYYKSGELDEEFHYKNGRYDGKSFKFNKKGEKVTTWNFKNGRLVERKDHIIEFNKKTEEKVKSYHQNLKDINKAILENPKSTKLRAQRARIRHFLGNYTLALKDYSNLKKIILKIQKTKKVPEKIVGGIYDHLAGIYSYYEMENQTIHYKVKAVIASPKESRLYNNLGNYLVQRKLYRLGITYLNKAIEMVPGHSFANLALAAAYTDLEDYEKAMICVNTAFKNEANLYKRGIGDHERDLWTIRGFLYHKLGESDKGIADLEEALNIDSDNSFALRNLGVIYHDLGNYDKSCELLQKAKTLGYEKIHDRYDLKEFLEYACNNKKTENKLVNFSDKPYIYPNPATVVISIKNFEFKNYNYSIYNFESKLMYDGEAENNTMNISSLSTGLYVLRIEAEGEIYNFKIVKE